MEESGIKARLVIRSDAVAAIGIVKREGLGRIRHLAVSQLWVQEEIREGVFALHKCPGERNPADLCAKYLNGARIEHYLRMLRIFSETGRAVSAPALTAEAQPYLATYA